MKHEDGRRGEENGRDIVKPSIKSQGLDWEVQSGEDPSQGTGMAVSVILQSWE